MQDFQAGEGANTKFQSKNGLFMFEEMQGCRVMGAWQRRGRLGGHEATRGQIP